MKKNGASTLGVANAAHCTEPLKYSGTTLNLQNQLQSGDDDTAWYTTPGYTPDNVISTDSDSAWERTITGKVSRANQPIGYTACKYGKSTGYHCGQVTSRTLAPGYITNPVAVFMRLDCGVNDCSSAGDSGGPVFKATGPPTGNTASAVGIISGAIGSGGNHDVIYMAANYIAGVGADVLTS